MKKFAVYLASGVLTTIAASFIAGPKRNAVPVQKRAEALEMAEAPNIKAVSSVHGSPGKRFTASRFSHSMVVRQELIQPAAKIDRAKFNASWGKFMKLKIIHTNDVHSHFENFSRAASLIRKLKDEHTLLLDGGDFADFKSIELRGTKGMAAVELLEALGYDALTIGNNEMFNGVDTLEHMATHSRFPFISINLFKKDRTKINGVVPSAIIEKGGCRILITGASPDLGVFNDGLGIYVPSYKEAIYEEIKRNQGKYDLCVVLNHVGTAADEELAREISEINVILSAHDHKLFSEAKRINGTILNSAGCYGEYVGVLELEVADGMVELLHSATLSTAEMDADDEVMAILKTNKAKAVEALSRPLYAIDRPLWHDVIEENPLTNLIADGLREMLACDIGLINSGIVNAGIFRYLTEKKLIEVCPSPLNPTAFEIKGKDIRTALEQSLDVQVCLADGRGPGFRGKYAGRLHVSGATVIHDGTHVVEVLVGDQPLRDEAWYTVASSDYLQRGSGYPSLAHNRNAKYRAEEIRDVIRLYACDPHFIEKAYMNRWKERQTVRTVGQSRDEADRNRIESGFRS
ncbi:bifunctional metallophosphatase/5'-nucleotidase [Caenibacillus caldisaponilyticus]|uniref:bifunctional metallophosphatase/5'-nucleotidase n=1 Tax=Caenibacillus caldisaponilyticus TaxID=1674942 RepID=UPI001EE6B218|nr:bifunctional UDP-sugar hydrolase/5'-nucleotidase [Caenibacillus caldisaponilyticus]